jgi:hypothetical protein
LQGFLNKFLEKKKENEGFFCNVRFLKDFEAFKYIFREVEAFVYKYANQYLKQAAKQRYYTCRLYQTIVFVCSVNVSEI